MQAQHLTIPELSRVLDTVTVVRRSLTALFPFLKDAQTLMQPPEDGDEIQEVDKLYQGVGTMLLDMMMSQKDSRAELKSDKLLPMLWDLHRKRQDLPDISTAELFPRPFRPPAHWKKREVLVHSLPVSC
jgi:hypothetical protein